MEPLPTEPPADRPAGPGPWSGQPVGSWSGGGGPGLPAPRPAAAGPRRPAHRAFVQEFAASPVTVSLVVVTVAVWLVHLAVQHLAHVNTDLTLGDQGMAIHGQWWRLVTPMVVHFGVLHIGLNMLALWNIGRPVEKTVGRAAFLAAYLLSGIGGQIASDLYYGTGVLAGGASGAIFGIVGVLIGNYLTVTWLEKAGRISHQQWRFNPRAVKSLAIQCGLWLVLGSAILHLDNAAHVGGAVVGLVAGAVTALASTGPAAGPSGTDRPPAG